MARVGLIAAALFFGGGCQGAGGTDDLADVQQAHTTSTPGAVAWARMNGGPGLQDWRRVITPPGSNLTWVGGRNGTSIAIRAYDPDGAVVEDVLIEQPTGFQDLQDLAVHEDESRTVLRSGTPDGVGCPPEGDVPVTEIVRVEGDGTCRWSYSFASTEHFPSPFVRAAAGADGSIVIAGVTYTVLHFGSTTVGGDAVYDPSTGGGPSYRFIVKLDAAGDVVWAKDLGHDGVTGVAVDGEDNAVLVGLMFNRGHEVIKWGPGGGLLWRREMTGISPFPAAVAASPTGDVVLAGRYIDSFTMDGVEFEDAGDHPDLFVVRLSSADGTVEGVRRLYGSGNLDANGLSVDPHGNIAVVGTFYDGSLNLGPNRFVGGSRPHGFAAVFSPALVHTLWARAFGTDVNGSWVECFGVAFTSNSRAMVAGHFNGTVDFGGHERTGERAAVLLRIFP